MYINALKFISFITYFLFNSKDFSGHKLMNMINIIMFRIIILIKSYNINKIHLLLLIIVFYFL